jgi:hypothetical protein
MPSAGPPEQLRTGPRGGLAPTVPELTPPEPVASDAEPVPPRADVAAPGAPVDPVSVSVSVAGAVPVGAVPVGTVPVGVNPVDANPDGVVAAVGEAAALRPVADLRTAASRADDRESTRAGTSGTVVSSGPAPESPVRRPGATVDSVTARSASARPSGTPSPAKPTGSPSPAKPTPTPTSSQTPATAKAPTGKAPTGKAPTGKPRPSGAQASPTATSAPAGSSASTRSGPAAEPGAGDGPDPGGVDAALPSVLDTWRDTLDAAHLADTLLVSGNLAKGTLDLTHAHPSGLATLLAGVPTRLSSLIRGSDTLWHARQLVRDVRAAVGTLRLERGMRAGYLAVGVASWRPGLSGPLPGRDEIDRGSICAPILLRGCALRPRGASHDDYDLVLDGTALVNAQLLRRLQADYSVQIDGVALAGLAFGAEGFDPGPAFRRLEDACRDVPGFRIERSLLLGTFSAGSADLRADLDAARAALGSHRLLSTILASATADGGAAGHAGAAASAGAAGHAGNGGGNGQVGEEFDRPAPVGVGLELDPAQLAAVEVALSGADLAIEGPPGTGLTQTVAATVAGSVARGRTVLVVTPHQGTAEALCNRLAAAGLDDAVLDLHDGSGDRDAILTSLGAALDAAVAAAVAAADDRKALREPDATMAVTRARTDGAGTPVRTRATLVDRLTAARNGLLECADALHEIREPWGVCAYDAMVALADLMAGQHAPLTRVRLPVEVTRRLDTAAREHLRADLRKAAALGAFTLTRVDTRWLDARVGSDEDAERALEAAARARDALPRARASMDAVTRLAGMAQAEAVGQWRAQLDLLLGVRDTLDVMLPAVYEQPIDDLVEATAPKGMPLGPDGKPLGRMERRRLRRRAKFLVRPGVHAPDLHTVLVAAREQRLAWRAADEAGGWPRVPTGLAEAQAAVDALEAALVTVCSCLVDTGTPDLLALPVDKLAQRLADLACDGEGLRDQPQRTVLLDRLRAAGLDGLIADLRQRQVGPESIDGELDLAWWTSVLEAVIRADPRLARHDPFAVRKWVADLREADAELAGVARDELRRHLIDSARRAVQAHPGQVRWLRAEVVRGHRSVWPADLFARARDLLGALRPVWVMSPDAVARLLPPAGAGRPLVDLVVVDDANQVGMPEAAASLARGKQVVVAGDRRRLPPSTGGPSVLEVVAGAVGVHRLDRDHRARDLRLVQPLSGCYLQGWTAPPGAASSSPLRLVEVSDGIAVPRPGEDLAFSADAEVACVVGLVAEHALRRPGESLLVVTLGARHAERSEGALRSAVTHDPALAAWLDVHWTGGIDEPFGVRPVHRLAGLERDAAIVSVGLTRTPHGRVVHRFGVLDGRFGTACLVAALSRARRHTDLVCAFTADDLSDDRVRTPGARMLRDLLETLRDGPLNRAAGVTVLAGQPDALVADLRERLRAVGMPVQAGFPAPDRPLDLAVGDPLEPGRMLLAIDLDGPGYAACRSVRLRDRLRAQSFERAGWSYLRVSAMDLFCDPEGEVERIQDAWRAAGGLPASVVPSRVVPVAPVSRRPWPEHVAPGLPISAYTSRELDAVAGWVVSDGAVRSPEQVAAEVRAALGFAHREPRLDAAVGAASRRALQAAAPAGR